MFTIVVNGAPNFQPLMGQLSMLFLPCYNVQNLQHFISFVLISIPVRYDIYFLLGPSLVF